MISSLQLDYDFREWPFDSTAARKRALEEALAKCGCRLEHRWRTAPGASRETIGLGGYKRFNLQIPPGSLFWGIQSWGCNMQITDLSTGYKFFSSPITPDYSGLDVFPIPYPVTGSGAFLFEFWNGTGAATFAWCNFMTAEPLTAAVQA